MVIGCLFDRSYVPVSADISLLLKEHTDNPGFHRPSLSQLASCLLSKIIDRQMACLLTIHPFKIQTPVVHVLITLPFIGSRRSRPSPFPLTFQYVPSSVFIYIIPSQHQRTYRDAPLGCQHSYFGRTITFA